MESPALDGVAPRFQPVVAAAAFQEQGGVLGSEPTLLLPGHSRTGVLLAKVLMVRWAKQYNQDSFIYAGPETNGEIHLFTVVSRGVRGLPTRYSCQVSLGRSDQSTGIKTLIRRLYASAE